MKKKEFGPVLFIPGLNSGKYPYCNSIYIQSHGILVDPASDRERLIRLKQEENIRQVWLTHFHEDHIMHLDLFEDVPFYISEMDAPQLSDINLFMDWDWFEYKPETRDWWFTQLKEKFNYKPRKAAGFLADGQVFTERGVTLRVIHTPGHTPGSLSFYLEEHGVLFIGDYDLTPFGPYYGDRGSSIEDTVDSIEKLRQIPAHIVLTGHEEGVFKRPGSAVWERYVGVIRKRENRLLEFLSSPRTMQEIVDAYIVYGRPREPKSFFELGERALMKKHLELLIKKKMITHKNKIYRLS